MTTTINNHSIELLNGDTLKLLPSMSQTFSAVITDPPYSSGAGSLTGKQQSTAQKYTATKGRCPYPDFEGDSLDQRSWTRWVTEWLRETRALCSPGAPLCVFSDWRQLPSLTDAVQWSGWTWRGVAVWDKVTSRPQRGRFRQQAEFVTWASNGPMPVDRNAGVLPGVLTYIQENGAERVHQTQKPLDLMRQIVHICEPGGVILDPFAGSGTTLLAAALEGYDAVGIELSKAYYSAALKRLNEARRGIHGEPDGESEAEGCTQGA